MVPRLSELLERIRPAGAPGGATEGERLARQPGIDEIERIAVLLRQFDDEADHLVAEARDEAQEIALDADRQARHIVGDLPDRLAAAHISGAASPERRREEELQRIADDAASELERLDALTAAHLPGLVKAAMTVIRGALEGDSAPALNGTP